MTDDVPYYIPRTADEAITLAVDGCRALAAAGQSDMVRGHPSVRDPEGRGVWMKCSGWGFEEITAERVVLVDRDGGVLAGHGPRHIEYPIHTEIMAARPEVGAVVHSHSPAACQFAALDEPLRPLDHAGSLFCCPGIPRFTRTGGLIKNWQLGQALAAALGDAVACLMPQHGIVAAGPGPPGRRHDRRPARPRLPHPAHRDGGLAAGLGRRSRHGCQAGRRVGSPPAAGPGDEYLVRQAPAAGPEGKA